MAAWRWIYNMQFTRESSLLINFVLNELLPPIVRDSKIVMWVAMKLAFGRKSAVFYEFREKLSTMSEEDYVRAYEDTEACNLLKGSDLNEKCKQAIVSNVVGESVLDVGCGRGELLDLLSERNAVGCDIFDSTSGRHKFVKAFAESLPFENDSFDTVVCTHVLEHVRNLPAAVNELRRVAASRILIVVPRERPYRFGFNLHVSFFPYEYSLYAALGAGVSPERISVTNVGGDWFYVEEVG